jgi:mycothiol synthase
MIEIAVAGDDDLDLWARIKSEVVPNEPVTAEQLRATDEPGRLLVLARSGGEPAGCGIAAPSSFGGRAFVGARVLAGFRRQGIGTALVRALAGHARGLGLTGVNAFVYADEPHSVAFAEHFGLAEVDYQLEQIRTIGSEDPPPARDDVELVALDGQREELLRAAWPVALEGYEDLPVPGVVTYKLETWIREEATRPGGSFVARQNGELVGYAGLMEHANGSATAEHGLTVVRRDRRRLGIGRMLKQAQLHWAAQSGLQELVTWTQKGNDAMQALNRSLGYVDTSKVITFQGELP